MTEIMNRQALEQALEQERSKYRRVVGLLWVIICLQGMGFLLALLSVFQTPDASTSNMIVAGGFFLIAGFAMSALGGIEPITLEDEYALMEA